MGSHDDVFILFRHLFLSQLVRCSFVVPSVPASMSSRQSEPPTKAHLCYFVAIFLIEASESFMVHHDDLFIVFRHFFPSSSGHCSCAAGVAISTLHKKASDGPTEIEIFPSSLGSFQFTFVTISDMDLHIRGVSYVYPMFLRAT